MCSNFFVSSTDEKNSKYCVALSTKILQFRILRNHHQHLRNTTALRLEPFKDYSRKPHCTLTLLKIVSQIRIAYLDFLTHLK